MQDSKNFIRNQLNGSYSHDEIGALTRLILEKVTGRSFSDILACKFTNLSDQTTRKIAEIIARLKNREPIQYIFGEADFWGLTFRVNRAVLIPRPETEELVQWIIEDCSGEPLKALDIGTGSGCIAVTLAKKMPSARIHAWDISEEALEVARENAARNNAAVIFSRKDVLNEQPPEETFDLIVSNPPYIAQSEKKEMDTNVLNFEPHLALFVPDENPLIFYEKIARLASGSMKKEGKLFFEINRQKANRVASILRKNGFRNIEIRKDISGNERMIKAEKG